MNTWRRLETHVTRTWRPMTPPLWVAVWWPVATTPVHTRSMIQRVPSSKALSMFRWHPRTLITIALMSVCFVIVLIATRISVWWSTSLIKIVTVSIWMSVIPVTFWCAPTWIIWGETATLSFWWRSVSASIPLSAKLKLKVIHSLCQTFQGPLKFHEVPWCSWVNRRKDCRHRGAGRGRYCLWENIEGISRKNSCCWRSALLWLRWQQYLAGLVCLFNLQSQRKSSIQCI